MTNGLPDIPVNAMVIDSLKINAAGSTDVYVGTDDGVYFSPDAGLTWTRYGAGLPHSSVFGMDIQTTSRILRIGTHGREIM